MSVTWDIVPKKLQHGEIKHYTVTYWKTEEGEEKPNHVNATTREVKLTGLAKYTYYSISVVAYTIKGGGPSSTAIDVRTDQDSK